MANAFVLEVVKLGGHGREIAAPLIRAAVLDAGGALVMRDPALQRRYATFEDDIPNEMRRPVSVLSVSESTVVPFETVRRQIVAMLEEGSCRRVGRGIIIPSQVTSSPLFARGLALQFEALTRLYADLRRHELVGALTPAPGSWPSPPVRLAGRLAVQFILRFRERLARAVPNPVSSLMLMEIVDINLQSLRAEPRGGIAADGFVPDELRTPASTNALAQRLGIAEETARRQGLELAGAGWCRRVRGGLVVPSDVIADARVQSFVEGVYADLQTLFAKLAALGVEQVFSTQTSPPAGTASE